MAVGKYGEAELRREHAEQGSDGNRERRYVCVIGENKWRDAGVIE